MPREGFCRTHPASAASIVCAFACAVLIFQLGTGTMSAQPPPPGLIMPGKSHQEALPPLSEAGQRLRDQLRADVAKLAGEIGERNVGRRPKQLKRAARWIAESFRTAGYQPRQETFPVDRTECANLYCELAGQADGREIVLLGAHYDSVAGCPAANDNGSGVAALLALSRLLADRKLQSTVRFVAFVNEEPPYFQTKQMGSWVHARGCRRREEKIVAMLSLETMGCFFDAEGSQQYPPPLDRFYPSRGNFIALVGNLDSSELVKRCVGTFREHAEFPCEGGALPSGLPGVGWSDHWSFWQFRYPALMVTDTAPYRYPHYHQVTDTPDKLDYDRLARVVDGLTHVVVELAGSQATGQPKPER